MIFDHKPKVRLLVWPSSLCYRSSSLYSCHASWAPEPMGSGAACL